MKIQIRTGVFETNSSTVHTLTICPKNQFEKWKNGELAFDDFYEKFVEYIDPDNEDLKSYEDWHEDEYLETYEQEYETEHGDRIVVFGKFGHD